MNRYRRHPAARRVRCHEFRVLDGHAEPESPNVREACDAGLQLSEHKIRASVVASVDIRQRFRVVRVARPSHARKVDVVADAVVVERHQELLLHRVPQPQFRRDSPAEVRQQRASVHALWGGREAHQRRRGQRRNDVLIRLRRQVVTLIDDDVGPVVRRKPLEQSPSALHRGEYVIAAPDLAATRHQLTKRRITEHVAERVARLLDELVSMREHQQPRPCSVRLRHARVVERRDHGLARARRRHHKVPSVSRGSLRLQPLEDRLLERIRRQRHERQTRLAITAALRPQHLAQPRPLHLISRVVGLELDRLPQGLERAAKVIQHVRQIRRAHLQHPFVSRAQRRRGEVRRANIGGRQLVLAMKAATPSRADASVVHPARSSPPHSAAKPTDRAPPPRLSL